MRRPRITLPSGLTDRLPNAISQHLPGVVSTSRRVTGKRVAIGGGVLTALAAVVTAGVGAARKRYDIGSAQVMQLIDHTGGAIVVLDNDKLFWVPAGVHRVIKVYLGDGAPALPYKIDRYRRHLVTGLATGTVNINAKVGTGLDD